MVYIGMLFLLLSGWVALANIFGIILAQRDQRKGIDRGYSCIPLFSLIFSFGAWLLAHGTLGLWAFLPAIVDPGSLVTLYLPVVVIGLIKDWWRDR